MEQAHVLVILTTNFPSSSLEKIKKIPGVTTADLIYGPYDMLITIKVQNRDELQKAILNIRETEGIRSTVTCNIIPT